MPDTPTSVLSLAAQIVSAHVSNNAVAPDELPQLMNDVYHALTTVGQGITEQPNAEPVVPIKNSVFADHLVCLDCGKHFSVLKRHIRTEHNLTVEQYRQKWGLPLTYPMISPDYARLCSNLANKFGLDRGGKATKKVERMAARK